MSEKRTRQWAVYAINAGKHVLVETIEVPRLANGVAVLDRYRHLAGSYDLFLNPEVPARSLA